MTARGNRTTHYNNATPRVCSNTDCATILSRYNPQPVCALHGGDTVPLPRGSDGRERTDDTNAARMVEGYEKSTLSPPSTPEPLASPLPT
jgi:hypothetical protein